MRTKTLGLLAIILGISGCFGDIQAAEEGRFGKTTVETPVTLEKSKEMQIKQLSKQISTLIWAYNRVAASVGSIDSYSYEANILKAGTTIRDELDIMVEEMPENQTLAMLKADCDKAWNQASKAVEDEIQQELRNLTQAMSPWILRQGKKIARVIDQREIADKLQDLNQLFEIAVLIGIDPDALNAFENLYMTRRVKIARERMIPEANKHLLENFSWQKLPNYKAKQ